VPANADLYSNLIFCGSGTGGAFWCCDPGDGFCCDQQGAQFIENNIWGTQWYYPDSSSSAAASASCPTTSSANSATGTKTTSEAAPHSTSPAQGSSTSSTLPTAIGAGVGVPLGLLAIGVIAFLFWRVRRKNRRLPVGWQGQEDGPAGNNTKEVSDLSSGGKAAVTTMARSAPQPSADGSNCDWHELSPDRDPHELDAPPQRVGWRGLRLVSWDPIFKVSCT
jgi:hypothetical protein